ncbi:MAG TPA: MFS transporter [Dehalococcoidia bacterium]|nr:MFS transporter [Dehalococcoidia bacterium]
MQQPDNSLSDFMPRRRKIFYGWWMVAAAVVLNFFVGGTFVYGFTVFFNPIRNTFGWGAAVTSVAFTLQRLESGFLEAAAGFLVDRVGPRKLMLGGWTTVGLGFFLMSRVNSLWAFYGSFLLIAVGMSFAAFIVIFATVTNWFEKKRSRAMTLVVTGFGASGMLVPLVSYAVGELGWRETLVIVAIAAWVIGIPLASMMRHKPEQYGYLPDGASPVGRGDSAGSTDSGVTSDKMAGGSDLPPAGLSLREAMKTRAFWLLAAVFFFQFIGASAVMVHLVPYLESVEVSSTLAATVVTGVTISSLIGRLGFGLLGDFANKQYLITVGIALQAIGVFILAFINNDRMWLIIPYLLTYAPGFGATVPLRLALLADYFGPRNYGTIIGFMTLISMAGGLASPVIAGWIFDATGSYQLAWQLFALITVPALPLMLLAKPPIIKQA